MSKRLLSERTPSVILDNTVGEESRLNYLQAVFQSMALIAEYGDSEETNHLFRVSAYSRFIAESVLGWSCSNARRLEIAALLHDIGKVALPRELLLKSALFNERERHYMQQHTERGIEIIEEVKQNLLVNESLFDGQLFEFASEITLCHHENFDGSAYPRGIKSGEIPVSAQIVKLSDIIDALLSRRPYKNPWPWVKVRKQIEHLADIEFDERLIRDFLQHEADFLALVKAYKKGVQHERAVVCK